MYKAPGSKDFFKNQSFFLVLVLSISLPQKPDPSMRADLQTFQLGENQTLINCYKSKFASSSSWENLFPHNEGYDDVSELNSFFVVTNNGIFECRPRYVLSNNIV